MTIKSKIEKILEGRRIVRLPRGHGYATIDDPVGDLLVHLGKAFSDRRIFAGCIGMTPRNWLERLEGEKMRVCEYTALKNQRWYFGRY